MGLNRTQPSVEVQHTIIGIFVLRQKYSRVRNFVRVAKSMQRNQSFESVRFTRREVFSTN